MPSIMTPRQRTSLNWLLGRLPEYPWLAAAPTAINPRDEDEATQGGSCSAVLCNGERTWAFRSEALRDEFVTLHASAGVRAITNTTIMGGAS